jgi:glycosyltransferase involved in cell wall biosynthesis
VNVSRWYDTREAFSQDLAKSQVFFAPRRTEGIGLSFLEALGLGMAVVASDGSTMNEYIRSGVNGYLYDPEQPLPPEWTQAATWGDNARRDFLEGRERWTNSVPAILEFLSTAPLLTKRPGGKKAFRSRWGALARYTAIEFLNFLRTLKRLSKQIFSRGHL